MDIPNVDNPPRQGAAHTGHTPVLLKECLKLLSPTAGGVYLDATFGGGGHSQAILESAPDIRLFATDRDPDAQVRGEKLKDKFPQFTLIDSDFEHISTISEIRDTLFDGILFDLGVSSFQLDTVERGFSFRNDAPADMRMDPRSGLPASEWLESADEKSLVHAIRDYGEERFWKRVVRAIISARGTGLLSRTATLANLITEAIPIRNRFASKIHPATRSFQGIRIAVNNELHSIECALPAAFSKLKKGGVLVVISFHSLEDRIVKHNFRSLCGFPTDHNDHRPQDMRRRLADAITRQPLVAKNEELEQNPRSRSAKLRAIRKL